MSDFWAYWYFHIPNFILAALLYTLLGRLILGLFAPRPDWDNYIWRFFRRVTDPVLAVVGFVTPAIIPQVVVIIFAALWIMALRVAYLVALMNLGLAPQGGGGAG